MTYKRSQSAINVNSRQCHCKHNFGHNLTSTDHKICLKPNPHSCKFPLSRIYTGLTALHALQKFVVISPNFCITPAQAAVSLVTFDSTTATMLMNTGNMNLGNKQFSVIKFLTNIAPNFGQFPEVSANGCQILSHFQVIPDKRSSVHTRNKKRSQTTATHDGLNNLHQ